MSAATPSHSPRRDGHVHLILLRHAESNNNVLAEAIRQKHGAAVTETLLMHEESQARDPDCALSGRGERQLECLQAYDWHDYFLKTGQFPKCRVYTSPMQRCLLTARAVARSLQSSMDAPVTVGPRLFEEGGCYHHRANGTPEGVPGATWDDIAKRFPEFTTPDSAGVGWYNRPHIETAAEFETRSHEIANWIWAMQQQMLASGHGALVLVMHGNIMSAIISTLFSGAPHTALYKHCNTGHTHIELFSSAGRNMAVCQSLNKVTHLLHHKQLIGGDHAVDDRWIQQFASRFR